MHDNDAWTQNMDLMRTPNVDRCGRGHGALCRPISFQTAEVYEISRELLMLVDGEENFCGGAAFLCDDGWGGVGGYDHEQWELQRAGPG